jgi:hypothetical protein
MEMALQTRTIAQEYAAKDATPRGAGVIGGTILDAIFARRRV